MVSQKRKLKEPKEPKKSKVMVVVVNPTEYFDDQTPATPPPDDLVDVEHALLDLNNETTPLEVIGPPPALVDYSLMRELILKLI